MTVHVGDMTQHPEVETLLAGAFAHGNPDGPDTVDRVNAETAVAALVAAGYDLAAPSAPAVPGTVTWPEMEALPIGSVVLFAGHPVQKVNEHRAFSGRVYQHWRGHENQWLDEDAVAENPPILLWTAEAR